MKMAKADEHDIDAAGRLLQILDTLSRGEYPATVEEMEDEDRDVPHYFDPDDKDHLRTLYDRLNAILDDAPSMPYRIIAGMCFVILYDKNQIVDPDCDTLAPHPRFAADARDAARWRYVRQFMELDDVGDEAYCLGLITYSEALEEAVTIHASRLEYKRRRAEWADVNGPEDEPKNLPPVTVEDAIDAAIEAMVREGEE